MVRKHNSRWIQIAALVMVLTIVSSAPQLRAATLHVYDLDSLIYLSSDIVEGEIVRSYRADQLDLIDIKISVVHKGERKSGQTVVVANTDIYRKPKDGFRNTQFLAVGDRLVLFMTRGKRSEFFPIPEDAVVFVPLPGGLMLTQNDGVFGFEQWDNPGPYIANLPREKDKTKLLMLEQFRRQISSGIRFVEEITPILTAKKEKLDARRLIKLLEDRNKPLSFFSRDYIAELTCSRLTEFQDPQLLAVALPLAKSHYAASMLQRGFGFPQGRDFLLDNVIDDKVAMESRLHYARTLQYAGAVYRSTFTEHHGNGHRELESIDEGNSGYLARIARAALANLKHEPLCRSLVSCVGWYGQGIVQNKPAPMMDDLRGALADTKPSQDLQFAIEIATVRVPEAYDKLKSPCGAVISILRPVDPDRYTKPKERSLIFEYEYATASIPRDVELRPSVVLENEETKQKVLLPSPVQIRGFSTGGGSNSIVLPKDLPEGKYRVYFQFTDGGKITSTGHYFTADL